MTRYHLAFVAGVVIAVFAQTPANACGDKLSMMGGGVSFELVNPSLHPARVVLFITPDSSLYGSRAGLQKKLERAGHTVNAVETAGALQAALQAGPIDLVLTNLGDARTPLPVATGSQGPALLALVYKPTAADFSSATTTNVTCTARVDKSRGSQLLNAVESVIVHKGTGLGTDCAPAGGAKST